MTNNKTLGYGKKRLVKKIIENSWDVDNPENVKLSLQDVLYIIQEMQDEEGKFHLQESSRVKGNYTVFKKFAQHLLYRNLANFDSMILITSEKGTGKSSAAMMLAREWCKLTGRRFNPKRHLAYNNQDVMNKIDKLDKFEPIVCDEAVRFATAADWNKKESKKLKKKLAQVRTKHLLFILCFPLKVSKVEKNYLDSFVNYWIDLFARGVGSIFVKDKNPVNDSWRMKEFKNVGSYSEFTKLSTIEKKLKKHPNFWKIVKFPKPPKWLYQKYSQIREDNVYDEESVRKSVTKEDIHKSLLLLALQDVMMNDTTLSMNRIKLHIKNNYDIPIAKKHIKSVMSDAKQLIKKIREEKVKEK